jgi:ureidoglycolate hydrolase
VPVAAPAAAAPVTAPTVDLSAMSKAQLVDYGRTHWHLRLDVAKSKTDLLAAIAKAARK